MSAKRTIFFHRGDFIIPLCLYFSALDTNTEIQQNSTLPSSAVAEALNRAEQEKKS